MNKLNIKRLTGQVFRWSTRPERTNAVGRSMVEMLGVLAIIGVLSAGAMAGYSKAMFRHRVNQTIDIFSQVLQRFSELEQKSWGENVEIGETGNGTPEDIVKYGILPNCQASTSVMNEPTCRLPIGDLLMGLADYGYVFGQFRLYFTDSKSCIAFSSVDWKNAVPQEWFSPYGDNDYGGYIAINNSSSASAVGIYDPTGVSGSVKTSVNMNDVIDACTKCDNTDWCYFYLVIRHEL